MPVVLAIILGIVEGLTEFLPVSSTGHLVLADHLLGTGEEGRASFEIVIQLGAVLAVLVHYRTMLGQKLSGFVRGDAGARAFAVALVVGSIPIVAMGLLFGHAIKARLFGPVPVAIALVTGGVVMIAVERWRKGRGAPGLDGIEHVTPKRALVVGLGQCAALWPGTSRSMATIVSGQLTGLSTATAAEFSFLLALPSLGGATIYEAYKARHVLASGTGVPAIATGLLTSFIVAWLVLAAFLAYLKRRGLEPFGYYRIAIGIVVLLLLKSSS
jgi:undecaprenyl-diphosphatase